MSETTDAVTLSTGHEVSLPLETVSDVAGATFRASWRGLCNRLPDGLRPIRAGPRSGLVTLLGVRYRRVGPLDPYREFGVIVPAIRGGESVVPGAGILRGDVGGWVDALPVTTAASVALGREVWGYPKEVAEVRVTDAGGVRETEVRCDGSRVVRLRVRTGGASERSFSANSFTEHGDGFTTREGGLLRTRADVSGELGVRPAGASVTVGEHGRSPAEREPAPACRCARSLAELGIRGPALGRLFGDAVGVRFHPGIRVEKR